MIVLIALTGFLILFPLLSYLSSRRMIGKSIEWGNGTIEKRLFYFYSPKCGPCRRMTPIIDKLAQQYPTVTKVDVSDEPETASRFGIRATPTTVLVKDNIIEEVMLGARSENQLIQLLK
jgi:thioredoxin 1